VPRPIDDAGKYTFSIWAFEEQDYPDIIRYGNGNQGHSGPGYGTMAPSCPMPTSAR